MRSVVDRNVVDRNVVDRNVVDRNVVDRNVVDRNVVGRNVVDRNVVRRRMPVLPWHIVCNIHNCSPDAVSNIDISYLRNLVTEPM